MRQYFDAYFYVVMLLIFLKLEFYFWHSDVDISIPVKVSSPGDRKISFAVLMERSDSVHSSTTSLAAEPTAVTDDKEKRGMAFLEVKFCYKWIMTIFDDFLFVYIPLIISYLSLKIIHG